ncbi:hypothetical protein [Bradyrhizobium canariense]|uniref:hypothetical protein n=1 Tax=Bradyrhizobium canariense TaxID=255045 RepID=UPI001B8A5866|nr:hypothetical protein [Bradyrhizobium canariense]MBR0951566.1 hypothetical protein [Bradyrhizobium canariense]
MLDQNNDYSSAGPGFKRRRRRERLASEEIPHKTKRPKPYLEKPQSAEKGMMKREILDISPILFVTPEP